jgi:succinate dehydrogenase / fumarate reductase membrane anchor subunit
MTTNNFGPKRLVVGAHYGLRDWLAQRITAAVMGIYTIILLVAFMLCKEEVQYQAWAGLFARQWFKVATFITLVALFYHVWVGMRDIWMDYVKPLSVRLVLQVLTILWLVGCAGYSIQILWRV